MSYKQEAQQKKRRQFISHSWRVFIVAMLFATLTIIVLFYSNLFDVHAVVSQVPNSLSTEEVTNKIQAVLDMRVLGITRRHNIILFSPQIIGPELMRDFPRIESVDISRISFHDLSIVVHERKRTGLWCFPAQSKCLYFDDAGIAFAEIPPSTGSLFIPVQDFRNRTVALGQLVESDTWRDSIGEVKKLLQFGNIPVSRVEIPADSFDEFHVVSQEGWSIYFRNDTDVSLQVNNLIQFLKEKISSETRKKLTYIDLRIEDRIYYK